MSDAATSATSESADPDPDPDADQLGALCRELCDAADAVGEAARYASGLALGSRLPVTALTSGSRRRAAWRTLLRALTDPAGLGWAPRGRGVARAGWLAGVFAGRESLAVSLAVCGLKGRIRAARTRNPGLAADPDAAVVLRAVEEDRQADAVREFHDLVRRQGPGPAFALLNPSFADILAWNALTDGNPFNDHAGWQIATGRAVTAEPLLGLGAAIRAFFGRGPACPGPESGFLAELDTTGTPAGYLRNAEGIVAAGGAVLLQQVVGADGGERYVVQLAGPPPSESGGEVSPEELYDGYLRMVAGTVRRLVPSGSELALVGRGPGALAAERLSTSRDFTIVYPAARLCTGSGSPAALAVFEGWVTGSHLVGLPGRPDVYVPGRPS
ncbi:hypothetical protein ACFXDJ_05400 [Streptomyces sp. NPDC059443]|uniref:hypothetical protein n=1 Tax=unclassified Streptomyces TaxID=2593676 RepID=UPI0036B5F242